VGYDTSRQDDISRPSEKKLLPQNQKSVFCVREYSITTTSTVLVFDRREDKQEGRSIPNIIMGKRKNSKKPEPVDHVSDPDSDDEELTEDEAFNSDDERKYGSFFEKRSARIAGGGDSEGDSGDSEGDSSSGDDDGIASDDDDSEEGDGGQYMLDLLDKLDGNDDKKKHESGQRSTGIASHVKESEFSASVVPTAGLTLDSLMQGIEDTKGFGVVQKTMRKVAEGQATSAPLARTVSARAQRKVHYEDQSGEVSRWIDAVQTNRQAETLDFRPKERLEITQDVLVDNFVPTTDFEKQVHAALNEAGHQDEEAMLKAEEAALQDDLGTNQITMEEYKSRRGQLAKMRALMFYHEQKRHQIKKIKSKKYRRIRKKQRTREKEANIEAQLEEDPDLARELEEKEEVDRMKERMTMAHKNTSKWAKRILKRGKNVDVDTRKALSAQLKRGDDLLQRMKTTRAGEDDDDSGDEDLVETARKVLADTEGNADAPTHRNGLFQLSFMQKGIERQREKAREEARELLMELEANEGDGDFDADGGDDEDDEPKRKKKEKVASKEEMKNILNDGELVASSLKFGKSNAIAVNGGIDIDMGPTESKVDNRKTKDSAGAGTMSEHSATFAISSGSSDRDKVQSPEKKASSLSPPKQSKGNATLTTRDESNPWLVTGAASDATEAPTNKRAVPRVSRTGIVDVQGAVDLLEGAADNAVSARGQQVEEPSKNKTNLVEKKITMLTQEELVRKAFVAPSEKEVDEEFAKEKDAMEEQEDDPTRKKKKEKAMNDVSGWGSWTGKGAPPPRPPRKLPKRMQAPEKKLAKRKREDVKKPNVIVSEKRVKKLADQFMVAQVPHPFTSREEYERAMAGGVGKEWNVTTSFKDMTRPEVMTRSGKIIQPLSKRVKQTRPAAKF
jgi:U3 small nucleolar RNA-associated protein 14